MEHAQGADRAGREAPEAAAKRPDWVRSCVDLAQPRLGAAVLAATDEFFGSRERLIEPAAPRTPTDASTISPTHISVTSRRGGCCAALSF